MCNLWIFVVLSVITTSSGILFPKDSPSRLVKDLNGVWNFRIDDSPSRNASFEDKWYQRPLAASGQVIKMPVPASFNDITSNSSIRDFVGWAWYERNFWVPSSWISGKIRVVLRFESAHYHTIVWVNGVQVMEHVGGHLPFEVDVHENLYGGVPNRVTAAVNNTMTPHTIPPGEIIYHGPPDYPSGYFEQKIQFDFYNYAGINRAVKLYTTPETYIDDIAVQTTLQDNGDASVHYAVKVGSRNSMADVTCAVSLSGTSASRLHYGVTNNEVSGVLNVHKPTLWWPWTMSDTPGYLYPLDVNCTDKKSGITDFYRLAIGIREVKVTDTQFLINGKPFYLNGVDKHEDWDIIGKGIDIALIMKDIYLLKWLGVAAFRTSHYPYAEEMLQLCDQEGIAVILESPAVGLHTRENFADVVLEHHLDVMTELISRDKNRPSVVMWSVANEPSSNLDEAGPYFKKVVNLTHTLDPTRPVTFACNKKYDEDKACVYMDVIMINQYFGWYSDTGHLELIDQQMRNKLDIWYETFKKPIMVSEYGAGTLPGDHKNPASAWSEESQAATLMNYWSAFDDYRKKFFIGELIWNFADFETAQGTNRPDGNRKGILTRQRQPKLAAHVVRERYLSLAKGRDYHPESIFAK